MAGKLKVPHHVTARLDWKASQLFDDRAARKIGNPDVVISWAWSALKTLTAARKRGIVTVLEECGSANAYQDKILKQEYETLGLSGYTGTLAEIIENEKKECATADIILCPSDYVAESFQIYGISRSRCTVIPYATNPIFKASRPKNPQTKLRILYVGSVGVRKGIIYLLKALDLLPEYSYECTVIGHVEPLFEKIFEPYRSKVNHIPSVPHSKLPEYFEESSVFVLPTLDEGMAYVTMEALASANPVITTYNSGATNKIIHNENGMIVPLRDPDAIAHSLIRLLENPELYQAMSEAAMKAATSWSWDDYISTLIQSFSTNGIHSINSTSRE
ncbi:MAG: glycosyltransferase family 4 protein [Verrucomicrobiota bacterium]